MFSILSAAIKSLLRFPRTSESGSTRTFPTTIASTSSNNSLKTWSATSATSSICSVLEKTRKKSKNSLLTVRKLVQARAYQFLDAIAELDAESEIRKRMNILNRVHRVHLLDCNRPVKAQRRINKLTKKFLGALAKSQNWRNFKLNSLKNTTLTAINLN